MCKYSLTLLITFKFGHAPGLVGKYFDRAQRRRVLVPAAYLEKIFLRSESQVPDINDHIYSSLFFLFLYISYCTLCFIFGNLFLVYIL